MFDTRDLRIVICVVLTNVIVIFKLLSMIQALCEAEDETDVQAAKIVAAEQKAEMAEFDENIPWDEKESEAKKERDEEMSKVEQELAMIQKEVSCKYSYIQVMK